MPDWAAIFEDRRNYCDVKIKKLLLVDREILIIGSRRLLAERSPAAVA